ncbi:peroxisomal biogenesis factor 16 [Reticulomyxa filosa]|uniref:Peroxisomal membrane protein PEX16 n=1 Tax=Reticulomyxa filosa TaxID=46433 RepID=X6MIG1_RETFI|nr:peroxisomal biogenesis factor 16 [Reticulomyxa filosa]|eukprot:ETO13232.1 peroxisomal biogenesis factor 16 [Reticulomyxa filosa]
MLIRLYLLYYFQGRMLILPTEQEMKDNQKRQMAEASTNYPALQRMYNDYGRGPHPHGHFSPSARPIRDELHRSKNNMNDMTLADGENHGSDNAKQHTAPTSLKQQLKQFNMRSIPEILHIIRPVIYVFQYIRTGMDDNQWSPFLVSLFLDVLSHALHHQHGCSNRAKEELGRRRTFWILYVLRAPFFQQFLKNPLSKIADSWEKKNSKIRHWLLGLFLLEGYKESRGQTFFFFLFCLNSDIAKPFEYIARFVF